MEEAEEEEEEGEEDRARRGNNKNRGGECAYVRIDDKKPQQEIGVEREDDNRQGRKK